MGEEEVVGVGFSGFQDAGITRPQAFEVFKQAADAMWQPFQGKPISTFCVLSDEEPKGGFLASLSYPANNQVAAIGNMIWRRAERYTLRVSEKLLAMDPEAVRKVLIHEAAHLGHHGHSAEFRSLVREHGGIVSELALDSDEAIQVQMKVGSRYTTVMTVATELEARQAIRAEKLKNPKGKYRAIM